MADIDITVSEQKAVVIEVRRGPVGPQGPQGLQGDAPLDALSPYTVGDIFYASAPTIIEKLAAAAVGNALISGGVGVAPAYGKLPLAAMANMATGSLLGRNTALAGIPEVITDIPTAITIGGAYVYRAGGTDVAVADGGTGKSSYTVGSLLYPDTATTIAELLAVAVNNVLISGGIATVPSWGKVVLTTHVSGILGSVNGGTGNGFTKFTGPTTAEKTFTLPDASATILTTNAAVTAAQGGTGQTVYVIGDLLYADTTTTLAKLTAGAVGAYLRGGGAATAPLWSTLILPNAATAFRLPVATGANTIGELAAVGATGEYLKGNTGAIPSWATLNQAAVAGLTTADGPTFAHLHISDVAAIYTAAESWVGPSSTAGIYFKGDNVGIGTALPGRKLSILALTTSNFPFGVTTSDWVTTTTGTTMLLGFGANTGNTYGSIVVQTGGGSVTGDIVLAKDGGNIGIGATVPISLVEIQGGLTTIGAVLTLSSKETSTVLNDVLGRIDFRAALDAAGTDAILTAASIVAKAENTFSASVNETGLAFHTGASEAAVERMRIDHHGNVGIGAIPSSNLHVASAGTVVITAQRSSANAYGPMFEGRKSRGTLASPTAVLSGDTLFRFAAGGYLATGWSSVSNEDIITALSTENWSDTASGRSLSFFTTPNTTLVPVTRMTIGNDGLVTILQNLVVQGTGNTTIAGNVGIGVTALGTSAVKVLGIGSGTAPTTAPADMVQMWVQDINAAAGYAGLHKRTETTNAVEVVPGVIIKTDTGSPANPYEGLLEINSFDNKVRMYADAGWRDLVAW